MTADIVTFLIVLGFLAVLVRDHLTEINKPKPLGQRVQAEADTEKKHL